MAVNRWTERDDATLKKMAEDGYDSRAIASRLSRSTHSIQNRAQKIGVKIPSRSDYGTSTKLRKNKKLRADKPFNGAI